MSFSGLQQHKRKALLCFPDSNDYAQAQINLIYTYLYVLLFNGFFYGAKNGASNG
jgi:hypothetical protein